MEETKEEYDVVEFPLKVLKILGVFSMAKSRKVIAVTTIYVFLTMFVVLVCLLQFMYIKGDITEFTVNAEALSGLLQGWLQLIIIAYQQKRFTDLLTATKSFWKIAKCPAELKFTLEVLSKRILLLEKVMLGCFLASAGATNITVLFGIRQLPIGIWKMEDADILKTMYLWTLAALLTIIGPFLGAFDGLFLALCTKSIVQFRILSFCIKELDSSKAVVGRNMYENRLKSYIKHHIFLLGFLKALRKAYSPTLFVQFITGGAIICMEMYALLELKEVAQRVRQGIILITLFLQLAFYSLATDYVVSEAGEISEAVYNSGWQSQHSRSLRSIITIAIQQAQQQVDFTAGGLVDFNSRALINVIKAAWSVCTVIRRLK